MRLMVWMQVLLVGRSGIEGFKVLSCAMALFLSDFSSILSVRSM